MSDLSAVCGDPGSAAADVAAVLSLARARLAEAAAAEDTARGAAPPPARRMASGESADLDATGVGADVLWRGAPFLRAVASAAARHSEGAGPPPPGCCGCGLGLNRPGDFVFYEFFSNAFGVLRVDGATARAWDRAIAASVRGDAPPLAWPPLSPTFDAVYGARLAALGARPSAAAAAPAVEGSRLGFVLGRAPRGKICAVK